MTVTLTSNDTNQARTAVTGTNGQFKFTLVTARNLQGTFCGQRTSSPTESRTVVLNVTESPVA